jgi:hypothetical protein
MSDVNGTVVAIQGVPVSTTSPNDGENLTFNATAGEWQPKAPPPPALQPWTGSVNTQQQIIQRIPWTCRTNGTTSSSTGVSVTLPTDTAASFSVNLIYRLPTSSGAVAQHVVLSVANNSGTMTSPGGGGGYATAITGTVPQTNGATFELDVSGTTATLKVTFYSAQPGVDVDLQGYVDLMVI